MKETAAKSVTMTASRSGGVYNRLVCRISFDNHIQKTLMAQGTLYIVSAPSGAGKSSLIQALLKTQPLYDSQVSVSHTTRNPRPGEVHGEHYFFVDHDKFRSMISEDAFLEHAEVLAIITGPLVKLLSRFWRPASMFSSISTGRAPSKFVIKCPARAVSLFCRRQRRA